VFNPTENDEPIEDENLKASLEKLREKIFLEKGDENGKLEISEEDESEIRTLIFSSFGK
jgi:hypothetical protein